MVAWNGSRESARALREGLEFIEQASRTVVLVVDPPTDGMPCADLKAHLAHHNVVAEVVNAGSEGRPVAAIIL
ncbi:universal stress protein, partial [Microvirga sp. HBU67558]|nr:universal stress protein [Microvirga sp. HBU67558]